MSNDTQQQSLRRSQFFHRVLTNSHSNILTFDQETLEDLWQKYDANQNGDLELDEIQAMMQGIV